MMPNIGPLNIILICLGFAAAYLIFSFFRNFVTPSLRLKQDLARTSAALDALKDQAEGTNQVVDPSVIENQIMRNEPFKHLWSEYMETLHKLTDVVDGEERIINWRATIPAEMFFSNQVLVDSPLQTEFFKHLPGLFTGIGIIGTFSGLIFGLLDFDPAQAEPGMLRQGLEQLLGNVAHAFGFSAVAIVLAMLFTFIEKTRITARYRQVEKLCQNIDSLYAAGVGEEYLSRLVKASEESATQTKQLKDSLVADLKEMMTNLVDRQIRETQVSHQAMSTSITQSISASLREPMEAISRVVDRASEHQGSSIQKALSDVIAGFMAKLEEVFGGQIAGLNALMQETASSMKDTRDKFAELADELSTAGKSAGEAMSVQLTRAMESAELRQRELNDQMHLFVGQIRELVSSSQSETSRKMRDILESLGSQVTQVVDSLSDQQAKAGLEAAQRQEAMAGHAHDVFSGLNHTINELSSQTSDMTRTMKEAIVDIKDITTKSIDKMNSGADSLYIAASEFSKAGQGVQGVFERATLITEHLTAMSAGLNTAAKSLETTVAVYERTHSDMTTLIGEVRTIIENAGQEASVSQELVNQLKSAVASFNDIQTKTETYLQQVNAVLTKTFESFTDAVRDSINRSRTDFDRSLSEAVEMLRSTIEDLDEGLGRIRRPN